MRIRSSLSISGLVVEYIVAIDVTRVRFPADAFTNVYKRSARVCDPMFRPPTDFRTSTYTANVWGQWDLPPTQV